MTRIRTLAAAGIAIALAGGGAEAAATQVVRIQPPATVKQLKPAPRDQDEIPVSHRPPPGMCRVWLEGVPPGQQPAPTDCASAVRNRPATGRVLFGDDYVGAKGGDDRRGRDTTAKDRRPTPPRPRPGPDSGALEARHHAESGPAPWEARGAPVVLASYAPGGAGWAFQDDRTARQRRQDQVRERQRQRDRQRVKDLERAEEQRRRDARRAEQRRHDDDADDDDDDDDRDARERSARDRDDDRADARRGSRDRVIVVPRGGDPRYYDDRYAPPGRANGRCLDRDRDGWCDDARLDAGTCLDRDGDGRCDDYGAVATAPYASSLPSMRAGPDVRGGRGSAEAIRWLGTAEVIARTTDLDRDGVPERIQWLDANTGQLLQVWTDRNRDGVADRVEVFRNGRRVKLFGQ